MAISVLVWQRSDELKKPTRSPVVGRLVVLAFFLLGTALAACALLVLRHRELEKQPRLPMHSVPLAALIHTDINFHDEETPQASPPPPPPASPALPPPRHPPPSWVVESMLPPRPVDASAHYNDTTDAYLVRDARPGTVLIGGKGLVGPYSSLEGAAVLLLSVCHCQPSIYGVVLSNMSNDKMSTAFCPRAAARYRQFVNSTVRFGGPNGPHWTVIARSSSSGAREIMPGLFAGGSLLELNSAVARGQAEVGSVAFYSGYVAWRLADLRKQIDKGQWLVAKAPASLLLKTPAASDGTKFAASLTAVLK